MARPKQHANGAAKQAAYRARQTVTSVVVDRAALNRLHEQLEALQDEVAEAARRGDPLARQCRAAASDTMLDKLIAAFRAAGRSVPEDPEPMSKPTRREK